MPARGQLPRVGALLSVRPQYQPLLTVNEFVAAEAKKFSDLLPEYRKDPELFFRLRQTETLARVLANAQEKIFVAARPDGKPRELRITIGREPEKRRLPEPPKKPDAH